MKILVLHGADSPEREISIKSALSVAESLQRLGYNYELFDPIEGDEKLINACENCDLVLPILHGKNGEDGVIQKKLESFGKKYLGSTERVSKVTIDKYKTHKKLSDVGILMPNYEVVSKDTFSKSPLKNKPFVLKPINGGSSIDVVIAREEPEQYHEEAMRKFSTYDKLLLEELIVGKEVTASILDNNTLPLVYIKPPKGEEFDFTNKYNGKSKEICPVPTSKIDNMTQQKVQKIALKAHTSLNVRHLSRSEFIIDDRGTIYMLEINTMPGLTHESLFPKAAKASGLSMDEVVQKFVTMASGER